MVAQFLTVHLFFTSLLLFLAGAYSLRQKGVTVSLPLALNLFLCGVFASLSGLGLIINDPELKIELSLMRGSFAPFIAMSTLVAAIVYSHNQGRFRNWAWPLVLGLVPLLSIVVIWFEPLRNFYRTDLEITNLGWAQIVSFSPGPWYWVNYSYNTLCSLVAFILLWNMYRNNRGAYRKQALFLLLGLGIPLLALLVPFRFSSGSPSGYPIIAHLFMLSALFCTWSMFRYHSLTSIPMAQNIALDNIRDIMLVVDADLRLIEFNKAANKNLRIDSQDVGHPVRQLLPEMEPIWRGIARREQTLSLEISLNQNGEKIVYEIIANPLEDKDGKRIAHILLLHEHSARRIQAKQQENIIQSIRQSPDGAMLTDENGVILYVNQAFCTLTGYKADELLGNKPSILKSGQMSAKIYEDLWQSIRAGKVWQGELQNKRKDGSLYWNETIITPMFDSNGKASRFLAFEKDISTQKELNNVLQRRLDELVIVNTISMAASAQQDLDELFSMVGELLEDLFDTTSVFIAVFDPQSKIIEIPYRTIHRQRVASSPLQYGEGLTSYVLNNAQPLLIARDFATQSQKYGARSSFSNEFGQPKTWLGVPIMARNQALGVFSLQDYSHENAFSSEDVRLLSTLAANIGITMQNARLYQSAQREIQERATAEAESRRRLEQMQILYEIAQTITSGLELDSVINTLLEKCRQIAPVDVFSVATYEAQTGIVHFVRFYDRGEERALAELEIGKTKGMTRAVILKREAIYIPDIATNQEALAEYEPIFTGDVHARSYLGQPLMIGDKVVGVLSVQCYEPEAYSAEQIQTLKTIGSQAAIAIENARLYEETRRRADEMYTMYQISLELSANLQQEQVMQTLLKRCLQLFQADTFYVAVYDENANMIYYPIYYDAGETKNIPQRSLRSSPGLTGEIIMNGKTIHIPDINQPNVQHRYQIIHIGGTARARSYLGVPMVHRGQVVGVLSVQNYKPHFYNSEHIQLLETIATQAAIAVENSRSYERARNEIIERRRAQESLQETNQQLQNELTRAEAVQEQLREQAIRDALTGLFNRRHLDSIFKQKLARAQRKSTPLSVIMLDIDHFKKFNDTYGHPLGDTLLQCLGKLLRTQTRASDIACRYGGEEFVLLMPDANVEIASRRAEELRLAFEQTYVSFEGEMLHATISLGIAMYPIHGNSPEELIIQADQALYAAKAAGRNQVVVWKQ